MEEQLTKTREELHDFKKKTKAKWDEVKVKFQNQRQNTKKLEQENKDWKMKYEQMRDNKDNNELVDQLRMELDDIKRLRLEDESKYNETINTLKLQSKNKLND